MINLGQRKVADLGRARRCKHCQRPLDPRLDGDRDAHAQCALLQPIEPRAWEVVILNPPAPAKVSGPFTTPDEAFAWLKRERPDFECAILQLGPLQPARPEHAD